MAAILNFITTIVVVVHSLQENMIQRLHKLYKHSAAVKETEQVESDCCAVCLNQMSKGEKVRSLPLCNHRYHADCIGAWLKNHTTCPLCRNKITDHVPQNQHKQVMKPFKESMIGFIQRFSDLLVVLLYTILPSSITETFPLVH
ncbi:Zinc finger, RING-type [Sesbania bispinosa]|nr:Zinc finger, RING-type [Sesbania bispinosa]